MKKAMWKYGLLFWAVLLLFGGCGRENPEEEKNTPVAHQPKPLVIEQSRQEEQQSGKEESEEKAKEELAELQQQIAAYIKPEQEKGTVVAVHVENLSTGETISVENQRMESASLIKLFVAGCIYENLDRVREQEAYAQETDELMKRMISVSDNDAANTLVTRLGQGSAEEGMQAVNRFCTEYGYEETHMGRLMLDFSASDDNYTSVEDCGKLLRELYKKELEGAGEILGYMQQQERTEKLPAGVPAGVLTTNKTGELTTVENDVAVVYADRGTYSICVMTGNLNDTSAGKAMITGLSSLVYQYMQTLN